MKARKLLIVVVSIVGSAFLLTMCLSQYAEAQKVVEWRMLSGWSAENPNVKNFLVPFVERVNQKAAGKLKISWVGPEAVSPFEQLKPVREGLFDAVYTNASYHLGEIAAGVSLDFCPASSKEMRAAGLFKILDELYRKKANVIYFSASTNGGGYQLYLRKKIDKADLSGLKVRAAPIFDPMIRGLGGAPVRLALGEVYSALDKGVIDGIMMMAIGVLDYKWYEVVKYMVRPIFGEVVCPVLVNLNSWNSLPKDLQDLLNKTAIEIEEEGRTALIKVFQSEEKELQRRGMEMITLPSKEAEKYLNTYYERGWEELVLKRDPEVGPRLKEIIDRMRKK